MSKKRILIICSFNNTVYKFLELFGSIKHLYEFTFVLEFKDKDLKEFLINNNHTVIEKKTYGHKLKSIPLKFLLFITQELYNPWRSKKLINEIEIPNAAFTFDGFEMGLGKWIIKDLNNKKIPTFRYAWGIYNRPVKKSKFNFYIPLLKLFGFKSNGNFQFHGNAENILVKDEYTKKTITENGINLPIHIIGNPEIYDPSDYSLDKKDYQNRILILSQPYNNKVYYSRLKSLLSKLTQLKNYEITLRLHPRDRVSNYNKIAKINGIKFTNIGTPLKDDIINSCIVIGYNSTALLNALYLNKNVIFYALQDGLNNIYNDVIIEDVQVFNDFQLDNLLSLITKRQCHSTYNLKMNYVPFNKAKFLNLIEG